MDAGAEDNKGEGKGEARVMLGALLAIAGALGLVVLTVVVGAAIADYEERKWGGPSEL